MTAPVIFRRDHATSGWLVGFFVPSTYSKLDDVPQPDDDLIEIVQLPSDTTFAVRTFGGFAGEADFNENLHILAKKLNEADIKVIHDEWLVVWASYDSPFTLFDRHNEVWLHVEGSKNSTRSSVTGGSTGLLSATL